MFFCKHYVELNLSLSIWVSSVASPPSLFLVLTIGKLEKTTSVDTL